MESNYSGRLSYGSSQPAMIPSSRSVLSRDKRVALDTWNQSGLQENVSGNQFSMFDSFRDHRQEIHPCAPRRERGSVPQATGTEILFARDDRPWTTSSTIPVDLPQTHMVAQQRQQKVELHFDKFPNPQSFSVWKTQFKNQVTTCSDFSIGHYVMDQ